MLGFFRRVVDDQFVPPLPPEPVLKPPRGFRFASEPPSLDDLVHLDNDDPYRNVRRSETIAILKGAISKEPIGTGIVIGRMGSRDRRANHTGPHEHWSIGPEGWPGIYFWNERGKQEWRSTSAFWRDNDGTLRLTR